MCSPQGATLGAVDKRALVMETKRTGGGRTVVTVHHEFLYRRAGVLVIFERRRHQGGQPSGDSVLRQKECHAIETIRVSFHRINAHGPVNVYVYEAGKKCQACKINRPPNSPRNRLPLLNNTLDAPAIN